MSRKHTVGIVGATGIAGQQFVVALQSHPWFTIERLAASERSAGKPFGQALLDATTGARRWWCREEPAADVLAIPVENGEALKYLLVSHNTRMGAAAGAVLVAEYLVARGYIA